MKVRVLKSRRVVCEATLPLPMSSGVVWGQLRDFHSSAAHDPFHSSIHIQDGMPRQGASLLIEHRYAFFRTVRQGRIVWWKEGVGYSFSDLSRDNPTRGFPHVFSYRLMPIDAVRSKLLIRVTGRWTMPGPRWVGWMWLSLVFMLVATTVENRLLQFAVSLRK
jgi:hypothetical protein